METLLQRIYASQKYLHVYTLSISTGKNQSTEVVVHYTFQHMSTITKLSPEVIQYYMNITSLVCAIAGIHVNVQEWTVKGTHEFTKGKLGRRTRGPGRIELWTVCWRSTLPLRHSDQQQGESTRSKLQDLDMRIQGSQMKLPRRVVKQKPSGEQGWAQVCIQV